MKVFSINSINNYQARNIKQNKIQNYSVNNNFTNNNLNMPTTAQYLAFLGGYSLDLDKVFSNLEDDEFPQDIQEMALEAIETPNNKDTLYDVHFSKYKGVLDCYSLEELKEKYPEFQNVNSAFDVIAREDSIVGKFQSGDLDVFSNTEDLTLQLIKLYWGQGFSLTDLSDYIAKQTKDEKGINLYYAMTKKLNIPLMTPRYANVLKKSNKEYNEQFSQEMSIKRKEAKEAKIQLAEGEAVVIPRGPLSEAHKKHISEGLKRHFQENPNKIYEMSKRQKEFYEQHPEKIEEMSEVMLFAWNKTQEGRGLIKHLSRFLRKYNGTIINPDDMGKINNLDPKTQEAFREFWKRNNWAKAQMSVAVKKGWEHLEEKKEIMLWVENFKTVPSKRVVFNIGPTQITKKNEKWAKEKGVPTEELIFGKCVIHIGRDNEFIAEDEKRIEKNKKRVQAIIDEYDKTHPNEINDNAACFINMFAKLEQALKKDTYRLPKSLKEDPAKIKIMTYAFNFIASENNYPIEERRNPINVQQELTIQNAYNIQTYMITQAALMGCEDFAEFINKELDKSYEELKQAGRVK